MDKSRIVKNELNSRYSHGFVVSHRDGVTLIELLITVAIIAILASATTAIYRNYVKDFELDSTARVIISDLRGARAKAMAGENAFKWGIRFVSEASGDNYYQLFSTPTTFSDASTTISETTYLRGGIAFTDPSASSTKDIIFAKITGTTSSSTVSINFEGATKTITVSPQGSVY